MRSRKTTAYVWFARSIVVFATILLIEGIGRVALDKALLTGTVSDPSGLGIPGIKITIINSSTGF